MKASGKIAATLRTLAERIVSSVRSAVCGAGETAVADDRGESYIGEVVKILIAVVVGALLLSLIYALIKDNIFPKVVTKVEGLFNFTGGTV